MARCRSGSVTVHVDVSDVLDAVDDEQLLAEIDLRKLGARLSAEDSAELLQEAYDELRRGRSAAALSILDRLLNPKWKSEGACLAAYREQLAERPA